MFEEIGSEFWDIPTITEENNLFPENTIWLLSGRDALKYIIRDSKIKSISIPNWCCESVIEPFVSAGVKVHFYGVFPSKLELYEITTEALLLIDYFGYYKEQIPNNYRGIVIRDITHSIFSCSQSKADYFFGSLRKWAGFWTGGFLWSNRFMSDSEIEQSLNQYVDLRKNAMIEKDKYISEEINNKDYLQLFYNAEQLLVNSFIHAADSRDIRFAKHIDVKYIRVKRRQNALHLMDSLSDMLFFHEIEDSDCPLFVPIIVPEEQRDKLQKHLISQGIFCPVHWPISLFHESKNVNNKLYKTELSLVCDQRYTVDDMSRISNTIYKFWEKW